MENTVPNSAKINTKDVAQIESAENVQAAAQKLADKILEKNLHERFAEYGKNAREWTRKCALLLPEIEKREIWRKRGFSNIYEYARVLAGMSTNAVNDALWVMKKAQDKPELIKIAKEKGINSIMPILTIATPETEKFWAEKVREMSVHTLQAYVREFKKADLQAKINGDFRDVPKHSQNQNLFSGKNLRRIEIELEPEIADQLEKLKGAGNWNETLKKLLTAYQENLEMKKPAAAQTESRYIPIEIKRHATMRTNNTCAFPNCKKPYEILHHTKRFALTHEHNPDSLVPLCKAHEQLAHLGLIENEEKLPSEWRVRKQPDKTQEKYKIDQLVAWHRAAVG
ncbi:hypothetical protein HZA39_00360 [Candidatus Peregrinibacteria bacterium]|nr:hypothetical protein [Candidatus Peregrinibacteria bacterium]